VNAEPYTIKQGDTYPLRATLRLAPTAAQRADGTPGSPLDLERADEVWFAMQRRGGERVVAGRCEVIDASGGVVEYRWRSEDTAKAGSHDGEFKIKWRDGSMQTVPSEGAIAIEVVKSVTIEALQQNVGDVVGKDGQDDRGDKAPDQREPEEEA
jgi:hypothetical protein